ncbi:alpha-amylase family glycosyl hydrolase [Paenibacillus mucilaginosus]|uniref:Alpha-amylase n=1 Tax=Paenibacillus mucilaginosus (strain KNP414) TaxID=1036673 RepID=F8F570_PAEMK|nr:alpha-amylase family glycosyl hydrolase [Paenibacillus mucilaginosus]AEI40800.1 Alpha-amylase [Paenibacillus mucilaginosus KNP414]MCG7211727.1 alpha-amylase family glycosyl hydrolase [Paenibacillus mucilaginosus]WDM29917.1 alpha-amylase [Paenibacillus mucilaginosus]
MNSFYDSNGDGHGDLKGIAQKLDYLNDGRPHSGQDRGISGVWMMPINASLSYHKYDVTDYYQVDPEYGTLNDFRSLMKEADRKGVKFIMDLVINHSSSEHPWFKEASADLNSKYRDYYIWADGNTDLTETGSWGNDSGLRLGGGGVSVRKGAKQREAVQGRGPVRLFFVPI